MRSRRKRVPERAQKLVQRVRLRVVFVPSLALLLQREVGTFLLDHHHHHHHYRYRYPARLRPLSASSGPYLQRERD